MNEGLHSGSPEPQANPFSFSGDAWEYTKLWMSTAALSVVTFGIYSAWSKVRRKRYLLGNTQACGSRFDYHANPLSILVSRIAFVSALLLINYQFDSSDLPLDSYYSLILAFLVPPLLARGLAFNARNTSYRTVRFLFDKAFLTIYVIFIPVFMILAWPLVHFLLHLPPSFELELISTRSLKLTWTEICELAYLASILAMAPYFMRKYHRYLAGNHSLGSLQIRFEQGLRPYAGYMVLVPVAYVAAAAAVLFAVWKLSENIAVLSTVVILLLLHMFSIVRAGLTKTLLNSIRFDGGHLVCNLGVGRYGLLLFITTILTLLSAGLLRPWSVIRRSRSLTKGIAIHLEGSQNLEEILGSEGKRESAIGDAASDAFDFDVGLV